jgi:hypothetical protein
MEPVGLTVKAVKAPSVLRWGYYVILLGLAGTMMASPDWQASLSKEPPGAFPPLRPLHTRYVFGWAGFAAATAELNFTRISPDRFQLQGTGRTTGLVRALWKYDVSYRALASASNLKPIESSQVESSRPKKVTTHLVFSETGVRRFRTESPSSGAGKPKDFNFPGIFDLHSAMLYLRSQPLKDRSVYRLVVYPATNPYLAIITVTGREKISVRAGDYKAIKFDLQLNRIGKDLELQPHRKFRRASIWVSDDSDRIILRIEAQVFVGTVFSELQSVHFDEANQ